MPITKVIYFTALTLLIIVIAGCTQTQTKYVCPDGSEVSDASLCQSKTCELFLPNPKGAELGYHGCEDEAGRYVTEDVNINDHQGIQKEYVCEHNYCVEKVMDRVIGSFITCNEGDILQSDGKTCTRSEFKVVNGFGDCEVVQEGLYVNGGCVYD